METDEPIDLSEVINHVSDGVYVVDAGRKIVLWNDSAARISGFSAEEVSGRCCAEGILTHVDDQGHSLCRNICPLAHTLKDGRQRTARIFLHHKAGHRVPVEIHVHALHNAEGRIVGAVETFRECGDVLAMQASIEHLKSRDVVDVETGLVSRKVAELRLAERVEEMRRFGWPFSVMLVEVDLLQEVRERFGEQLLPVAVRMAARSAQYALRAHDTVGRWDDNNFIAILANAGVTELVGAAERVRMMVDTAYRQTEAGELHVTVSVGASSSRAGDNAGSILQRANHAMYVSRTRGRNRVTIDELDSAQQGR